MFINFWFTNILTQLCPRMSGQIKGRFYQHFVKCYVNIFLGSKFCPMSWKVLQCWRRLDTCILFFLSKKQRPEIWNVLQKHLHFVTAYSRIYIPVSSMLSLFELSIVGLLNCCTSLFNSVLVHFYYWHFFIVKCSRISAAKTCGNISVRCTI